jgi:hypothetical protein
MKNNLGSIDKAIRIMVAVLLLIPTFAKVFTGTLAIITFVLAVALILTSIISFCPAYLPLGVSTNKKKA